MQTNLLEYLEQTQARLPDKIAISGETGALTFRALYCAARRVGSCLLSHGVTRAPVAVLMPRKPETVAAFLGAIYAGCYYVPLDGEMPPSRIQGILDKLDPGILICDSSTEALARMLTYPGPVITYNRAVQYAEDEAALMGIRQRQLDIDPVYIVFTSGSTGEPKGVVGCHRGVIDYIEGLCPMLGLDEKAVFGNQTPLFFDACLKEILPTLKFGAATHLIPKRLFATPVRLVEYLNQKEINTICWVSSALALVSSLGTFSTVTPKHLRTVAFASEVLPVRQLKLWQEAAPNARFFNLYGPTEATGICCYYEVPRPFELDAIPIGRPLPNTEVLLLDDENLPAKQGEICIRGSRLTLGYYRDRVRTDAAFPQNPLHGDYPERIYRTGDIGRRNERGELMFLGRRDSQIKHMGHRIELGEIEAAALTLEGICAACCLYANGKITLYYVGSMAQAALAAHLREKLPRYMTPQILRCLEEMPMTPNGKIDRKSLKQRSESHG